MTTNTTRKPKTSAVRFVAWAKVDTRTIIGATMRSSRTADLTATFVVADVTTGRKWVTLRDAEGVQHVRLPAEVVASYMAAVDAGNKPEADAPTVKATAAHVAALDGVSKRAAAEHARAVLSGANSGVAAGTDDAPIG